MAIPNAAGPPMGNALIILKEQVEQVGYCSIRISDMRVTTDNEA
jgi:hypothetical protein